jgi:hypothetical protein
MLSLKLFPITRLERPAIFTGRCPETEVYTSMRQRNKAYRPKISNMKFVERGKFLVVLYTTWNAIARAHITRTCILINVIKSQILFNNSLGKTCDFYVQKRRTNTSLVRQGQKAYRPQISNMKFVERPKFLILLYRTWKAIERAPINRTCILINVKSQIIFNNSLGKTCDFHVQKRQFILQWGSGRKPIDHRF